MLSLFEKRPSTDPATGLLYKAKYDEINKWYDSEFNMFTEYIGIRPYMESVFNNTLEKDYPELPFKAYEMVLWAKQANDEAFFNHASWSALQDFDTAGDWFGHPKYDVVHDRVNSESDQNGIIGEIANAPSDLLNWATDGIKSTILYGLVAVVAVGVAYKVTSKKASKLLEKV